MNLAQLRGFVAVAGEGSFTEAAAALGLTQSLQPKLRIRDTTTLLAFVREHVGVTVIPELSLTDQRGLAAIPIAPPAYRRLILTPADPHDVGPAARAFLDLAAHMTSLPGCGSPGTGTARPPRRPPAR